MHPQSIYLRTISALISLQGFINNEIAKHKSSGDDYQVNHWSNYFAKIEDLKEIHYSQFQALK